MQERLSIVTIDAASDVRGRNGEEVVGTSSGKGGLAQAFLAAGYPANDSGRGYRTITWAAQEEGVEANQLADSGLMASWAKTKTFGSGEIGLTYNDRFIRESELHGKRISGHVADYASLPEVRELMKAMNMRWMNWAREERGAKLVALDGRGMRQMVLKMAIGQQLVANSELLFSLSMVVNPVEAARRRMAQRKLLDYTDPNWFYSPGLASTILELRERALKDEDRGIDPVGIPKNARAIDPGIRPKQISDLRLGDELIINTTGAPLLDVQNLGLRIASSLFGESISMPEEQ